MLINLNKLLYGINKTWARSLGGAISYMRKMQLTPGKMMFLGTLVVLTILFSFNILQTINKAVDDYQVLSVERGKLAKIKGESNDLDKELGYYSSLDYRKQYAYDSLNLARDGESIYYIDLRDRKPLDLDKPNPDPVKRTDNKAWWNFLFGQMWDGLGTTLK
jgi:hypothetical protein